MFPDLDLKFKLFPVSILWHKVVTENLHGVINNHFRENGSFIIGFVGFLFGVGSLS
jgi:hypothetical protein